MAGVPSLEELWASTPPPSGPGDDEVLAGLPPTARRYLTHAIASGTPMAAAVRLRMHGEIRLGRWFRFRAEEVIRWDRGMIWRAVVRVHGVPVRGFDRLVDGRAQLRWRLLGLVPLVAAAGPDVARSAAGRLAAESVWLPSALRGTAVSWTAPEAAHARATLPVPGEIATLDLTIGDDGGLRRLALVRWGNPGGGPFRALPFGGIVQEERTFGGYTIPSRLRIGWHIDGDRFEDDGEFFRVTVDEARYR